MAINHSHDRDGLSIIFSIINEIFLYNHYINAPSFFFKTHPILLHEQVRIADCLRIALAKDAKGFRLGNDELSTIH